MNVILTHEHRFEMDKHGNVYTDNEHSTGYNYFKRYLDVFDSVIVVGRVKNEKTAETFLVTGEGVSFIPIPNYLGPTQYLVKAISIKSTVRSIFPIIKNNTALIARVPGKIGSLLIDEFTTNKYPYAMEVVSDPFEVFAPGAIRHPLRPIFRILFAQKLRYLCANACAISYVTEKSLQKRYPPAIASFSTHYSSIQMDKEAYIESPKVFKTKNTYELIFVGTLAQLYKAPDILIDAIEVCVRFGVDVKVSIVGDGKFRKILEQRAVSKGLEGRIRFLGHIPSGTSVRDQLDKADLFVLPSRGEGLPRAMIEAMARGLPCIGTSASGIPELLPVDDMVPPEDPGSLAKMIMAVLADPIRMTQMSIRNLEKSKEYCSDILQRRRIEFYTNVKEKTENFLKKQDAVQGGR